MWGWMGTGRGVGTIVGIMVGVGKWGELGGKRELLRLLRLLVLLLIRGLGSRDVVDAVAILLLVIMGRSFGGIGRLG